MTEDHRVQAKTEQPKFILWIHKISSSWWKAEKYKTSLDEQDAKINQKQNLSADFARIQIMLISMKKKWINLFMDSSPYPGLHDGN